jgi:hypothetical protein
VQQLNIFGESFSMRVTIGGSGVVLFLPLLLDLTRFGMERMLPGRGRLFSGDVMSDEAGEKKFDLTDRRRQTLRAEGNHAQAAPTSRRRSRSASASAMLVIGGGGADRVSAHPDGQFVFANQPCPSTVLARRANRFRFPLPAISGSGSRSLSAPSRWRCSSARPCRSASTSPTTACLQVREAEPAVRIQNIFSVNKLTQTGQNLVKLSVVASFAYMAMKDIQKAPFFSARSASRTRRGLRHRVAWSFGWRIVLVLVVLAIVDVPLAALEVQPGPHDDLRGR